MRTVTRRLASLMLVAIGLMSMAPVAQADIARERAPVVEIADTANVTGTSTLVRSDRGLRAVLRTGGLVAGDAYTVWFIVFNNPAACDGACDGADLTNPAVGGVSTLGAGKVVRGERSTFVMRMPVGSELTNPHGAEIHFVVRTHGPALPGQADEQTTTLNGGCPPNVCANLLLAKHQ